MSNCRTLAPKAIRFSPEHRRVDIYLQLPFPDKPEIAILSGLPSKNRTLPALDFLF